MKNSITIVLGLTSMCMILNILQIPVFAFLTLAILGTTILTGLYMFFLSRHNKELFDENFAFLLKKSEQTHFNVVSTKTLSVIKERLFFPEITAIPLCVIDTELQNNSVLPIVNKPLIARLQQISYLNG